MNSIIFDMDGVLIDSFEQHWKAFDIVMKKHFGFSISKKEFLGYFGSDPREITKSLLVNHGVEVEQDVDRLHYEKQEVFKRLTERGIKIFPEARETLKKLKKKKIKLALASSSSRNSVTLLMEKTGLRGYFKVLVGMEDTKKAKPDPEIYLKAAEKLKVKPEECWVIEDSLHGVKAGKKAGMKVVGVQTGFRSKKELEKAGADIVVKNLGKLKLKNLTN